jgi:hypothetical protein
MVCITAPVFCCTITICKPGNRAVGATNPALCGGALCRAVWWSGNPHALPRRLAKRVALRLYLPYLRQSPSLRRVKVGAFAIQREHEQARHEFADSSVKIGKDRQHPTVWTRIFGCLPCDIHQFSLDAGKLDRRTAAQNIRSAKRNL